MADRRRGGRALPLVELEEGRDDDTLIDQKQRIGVRDHFGHGPAGSGQGEPDHAEAAHSLGGSACHGWSTPPIPPDRPHHGAAMKQGDTVLIWGASGGSVLRDPVRPRRRRDGACCVRSSPRRRTSAGAGAELSSPGGEGLGYGGRAEQDPAMEAPRRADTRADRRRRPGIVFEHPGRESSRLPSSWPSAAARW